MEKLGLKHLAPYLPYGLKLIDHLYNKYNVAWMSTKKIAFIDTKGFGDVQKLSWDYATNKIKPILRPISDLTKEIEVNGVKVNVVKQLCLMGLKIGGLSEYGIRQYIIKYPTKADYWAVENLIGLHFDVFGLIGKDLAVDINTLKK